jgi:hypothetical protein
VPVSYPGYEQDCARPIISGGCRDGFDVRIMLSILRHVEWNFDPRGKRG